MASMKQSIAKTRVPGKQALGARRSPAMKAEAPKALPVASPPKEPSLGMLERGIDLLEMLAKNGPSGIAELAKKTDCAPVTATRLLRVLQTRGFAVCDETNSTWRLGTRWNAYAQAAVEQDALATTAMPFLTALGIAAGENAYIRVRDGMSSETIAVYRTDPALRVYTDVGARGPLHAGTSRMLLAHAPEAVQTQLLTQRLPRFTPATRTDPTWIAADLQRIRARGYLITADEVVPGAPTMRMRPPRPRALVSIVQDAAAKLSHALGYTRSDTMITAQPVPRKPGAPAWSMPSPAMTIRTSTQPTMSRAG